MNKLFGRRKEPRRSSEDDYNKMQYFTPRGEIPATVVEQQVREVVINPNSNNKRGYPHEYGNEEKGPNDTIRQNFQAFEQRNRTEEVRLYEVPINSRMNMDKKTTPFMKEPPHRNDRARVMRKEPNDPGAFRGVAAVERPSGRNYGVAGVIYHPEGNTKGFERAPMEPLNREGRQYLRRFADDDGDHRVTTWPPRDEDAEDLTLYEGRFLKERAARPKPVPKAKNKFFK
ncbi:hypothetical protein FLAG1_10825 [Fusarium langsethiae]|uniref:Uncharacterized protein n=1 Tax=Fusarium langsethiae TaxID=179993 RepID=A0A0N0DB83_FUSLA|nr:hypothetical protein FLAG1_10825 [Fusarium langsethiae]GKU06625.1 unnamed protein product [Fusarium langsethiae]GKU21937.1 unnamed protein product [Fusarium langsethiae]